VHLVAGFYVGVAASATDSLAGDISGGAFQPRGTFNGDATNVFLPLGGKELKVGIMPL
jgi:hypothetical protein